MPMMTRVAGGGDTGTGTFVLRGMSSATRKQNQMTMVTMMGHLPRQDENDENVLEDDQEDETPHDDFLGAHLSCRHLYLDADGFGK